MPEVVPCFASVNCLREISDQGSAEHLVWPESYEALSSKGAVSRSVRQLGFGKQDNGCGSRGEKGPGPSGDLFKCLKR